MPRRETMPFSHSTELGSQGRHLIPVDKSAHMACPAALSMIVSGIRLAAGLNLIGVLAAEILTSTEGIGYEITASSQNFEPATTYAYMIVAICVVAIFNTFVTHSVQR